MPNRAPSWRWNSDPDSPVNSRSPSPSPIFPPPRRNNVPSNRNRNVQNARTMRDLDNGPPASSAGRSGGGSNFHGAGRSVGQSQSRDDDILNLPGCRGAMAFLARGQYPGREADFERLTRDEQAWVRDLGGRMDRPSGSGRSAQGSGRSAQGFGAGPSAPAPRPSNRPRPAAPRQHAPPSRGRTQYHPGSESSDSEDCTNLAGCLEYGRPPKSRAQRAPRSAGSSSGSCTDLEDSARHPQPIPSPAQAARERNAFFQARREQRARRARGEEGDDECSCRDCGGH